MVVRDALVLKSKAVRNTVKVSIHPLWFLGHLACATRSPQWWGLCMLCNVIAVFPPNWPIQELYKQTAFFHRHYWPTCLRCARFLSGEGACQPAHQCLVKMLFHVFPPGGQTWRESLPRRPLAPVTVLKLCKVCWEWLCPHSQLWQSPSEPIFLYPSFDVSRVIFQCHPSPGSG